MYPYIGRYKITSPQGPRLLNGKQEYHQGIDMVGLDSKEIRAIEGGTVVRSRIITDPNNKTSEWGNYVAIQDSKGRIWYHCHLSRRMVAEGAKVVAGQIIGIEGNTGKSYGSHLHLEVRQGTTVLDLSKVLQFPVTVGEYTTTFDPAKAVQEKCGFEPQTMDYLNAYLYATDLWRKLWDAMK